MAWATGLLALVWGAYEVKQLQARPQETLASAAVTADAWEPYSKATLDAALKDKQAVFVDFTASWCVTCQVNKKAVLETEQALNVFKQHQVKLLRADWTNLDQEITDALAVFDRNSVPLYVYYPSDGSQPKILPQILTQAHIAELF